jgi:L-threonylcarbamoyladenylate synthase
VLKARVNWEPPLVVNEMIGLRWSNCKVIEKLMSMVQFPVTATSANKTGGKELDSIEDIQSVFQDEVALYLDAGVLKNTVSTVVKCTADGIEILREGAISISEIQREQKGIV